MIFFFGQSSGSVVESVDLFSSDAIDFFIDGVGSDHLKSYIFLKKELSYTMLFRYIYSSLSMNKKVIILNSIGSKSLVVKLSKEFIGRRYYITNSLILLSPSTKNFFKMEDENIIESVEKLSDNIKNLLEST